jgi:NAD(P)-dependent dehydrogenase (short-subunit alcohol dehydrogenase family)
MPGRLDGAVALITGGAGSLGSASARRLVAEGASVAVADNRLDAAEALAEEIDCLAVELDVTSEASWAAAVAAALERFGDLTVLVNNAGVGSPAGVMEVPLETWELHLAVNQTGVLLGMRAAVPSMRRAGGGSIVNMASIHGLVGRSTAPHTAVAYCATKGAVRLMTKAAAAEFAAEGIRVNSLHPGYVDAPMAGVESSPERERARELTPMGRFAAPAEVADAVVFLASPESAYMTGSELVLDGGYTAV